MSTLGEVASGLVKDMIAIDPGRFLFGSTREEIDKCLAYWIPRTPHIDGRVFSSWIEKEFPAHVVDLAPYQISRHPVTIEQFSVFAHEMRYTIQSPERLNEPGDHPVWGVSPADVAAFVSWLNSAEVAPFRLPSEAEWECAARGNTRREYPWGEAFEPSACNTREAGIGGTTPVDRYAKWPSAWGLIDMAGNVEEYTASAYAPYPGGTLVEDDSFRTYGRDYLVARGGSFLLGGDTARCARRHGPGFLGRPTAIGFRLAISL